MADITDELKALATCMTAYGRAAAARKCLDLIRQVTAIRTMNGEDACDPTKYIPNSAGPNDSVAVKDSEIKKLQRDNQQQHGLLMTYNARNMMLREALAEVLACDNAQCDACRSTLTNATRVTSRMHVKIGERD